LTRTNFNWQFL